jgi:hypothetical protein
MQLNTPKLLKTMSLEINPSYIPEAISLLFQTKKKHKRALKPTFVVKTKKKIKTTHRSNITEATIMYFERWGLLAPPPERQPHAFLTAKV